MQTIQLNLDLNEVNYLLKVIGDLPTYTGAYILLMKIKEQAEAAGKIAEVPPKED